MGASKSFSDPFGLQRQRFGFLKDSPIDNKYMEFAFTGPNAFMPQKFKMLSPWTGMQDQEDADNKLQRENAATSYGQYATATE
jgi:hypothetical protein